MKSNSRIAQKGYATCVATCDNDVTFMLTLPNSSIMEKTVPSRASHPITVRLTHWVGAAAMIAMILSGWAIYNASPILPFTIPGYLTLGGWLGAGIAWHIAAMWVLMADGLIYLIWGLASGHFRHSLLPISARGVAQDLGAALSFRLVHRTGHYNAVQKLLYLLVIAAGIAAVLSGLAIWKPVQLGSLTWLFGGYDVARRIHFALMSAIVAFLLIHITLVALIPSTLVSMITGGRRQPEAAE
jgi:thiosulfate reductase cytochrome b subunit